MRPDHASALAAAELDFLRLGLAEATRRSAAQVARAFLRGVERAPAHVALHDVRAFLAACQARGLAPTTQTGYLSHLRAFFAALERQGLVEANPTDGVMLPRPSPRPYRRVGEEGVARLLAAALDVPQDDALRVARARRDRVALELLYGLALRSAEVRAARVLDLDLTHGLLLVRRAKRGQPVRLPLPPSSLPHVRAHLESRPLLARAGEDQGRLVVNDLGRPYKHASGINKLVERAAKRAGLSVHPHALRRGAATHLIRAGAPILAVQHLLGHVEFNTTAIYVDLDQGDLRRAIDTLERGSDGT